MRQLSCSTICGSWQFHRVSLRQGVSTWIIVQLRLEESRVLVFDVAPKAAGVLDFLIAVGALDAWPASAQPNWSCLPIHRDQRFFGASTTWKNAAAYNHLVTEQCCSLPSACFNHPSHEQTTMTRYCCAISNSITVTSPNLTFDQWYGVVDSWSMAIHQPSPSMPSIGWMLRHPKEDAVSTTAQPGTRLHPAYQPSPLPFYQCQQLLFCCSVVLLFCCSVVLLFCCCCSVAVVAVVVVVVVVVATASSGLQC